MSVSISKTCGDCGHTFFVEDSEGWKTVCRYCYREEARARDAVRDLQARVRALERALQSRQRYSLTEDRIKVLIRLCHPDKHSNSPMSNKATAWLLALKDQVSQTH